MKTGFSVHELRAMPVAEFQHYFQLVLKAVKR
jgi:hypothetical protein